MHSHRGFFARCTDNIFLWDYSIKKMDNDSKINAGLRSSAMMSCSSSAISLKLLPFQIKIKNTSQLNVRVYMSYVWCNH